MILKQASIRWHHSLAVPLDHKLIGRHLQLDQHEFPLCLPCLCVVVVVQKHTVDSC